MFSGAAVVIATWPKLAFFLLSERSKTSMKLLSCCLISVCQCLVTSRQVRCSKKSNVMVNWFFCSNLKLLLQQTHLYCRYGLPPKSVKVEFAQRQLAVVCVHLLDGEVHDQDTAEGSREKRSRVKLT